MNGSWVDVVDLRSPIDLGIYSLAQNASQLIPSGRLGTWGKATLCHGWRRYESQSLCNIGGVRVGKRGPDGVADLQSSPQLGVVDDLAGRDDAVKYGLR